MKLQNIDVSRGSPCIKCGVHNDELKAMLLPFRTHEGFWTCPKCVDKVSAELYSITEMRHLLTSASLPDWMKSETFDVSRSDGSVSKMKIVDFKNETCRNMKNAVPDSRVQLDPKTFEIYLDMYKVDDKTVFKRVPITKLIEKNNFSPKLTFNLKYQKYITSKTKPLWEKAINKINDILKTVDFDVIQRDENDFNLTMVGMKPPKMLQDEKPHEESIHEEVKEEEKEKEEEENEKEEEKDEEVEVEDEEEKDEEDEDDEMPTL